MPTGQVTQGHQFDLTPDGQKFLFRCASEAVSQYTISVNWLGFDR